jgi:hypothetical protein
MKRSSKWSVIAVLALAGCSSDPPPKNEPAKPAPAPAPAPAPPAPAPAPRESESISLKGSSRPRPTQSQTTTDPAKIAELKRRAHDPSADAPASDPAAPVAATPKPDAPKPAGKGTRPDKATVGQLAPNLTVGGDLDGLMGRVVVVAFWTPGTQTGRQVMTHLRKLTAGLGDKPFSIIGILEPKAGTAPPPDDAGGSEPAGMPWPVGMDSKGETAARYSATTLPVFCVIDKKGVLRYQGMGAPAAQNVQSLIDEE